MLNCLQEITKENYRILEKEGTMLDLKALLNLIKPTLFKMIPQSLTEDQCLRMVSTYLSNFN
jgi:hypothetical protein